MQNFRQHKARRFDHSQTLHTVHAEQPQRRALDSSKMYTFIVKINILRPVCSAMFGKSHSLGHRMLVGVIVAGVGVVFAKYVGHSHNEVVAHVGDGVGYGLHALGLTPFIEWAAEQYR